MSQMTRKKRIPDSLSIISSSVKVWSEVGIVRATIDAENALFVTVEATARLETAVRERIASMGNISNNEEGVGCSKKVRTLYKPQNCAPVISALDSHA